MSDVRALLALQRTAGNGAVSELLQPAPPSEDNEEDSEDEDEDVDIVGDGEDEDVDIVGDGEDEDVDIGGEGEGEDVDIGGDGEGEDEDVQGEGGGEAMGTQDEDVEGEGGGEAMETQAEDVEDEPREGTPVTLEARDDATFHGGVSKDDIDTITTAIKTVRKWLITGEPTAPILVHFGVGVGNPPGGWGNPTILKKKFDFDSQVAPGFLTAAIAAGFRVVALNFNNFEGTDVTITSAEGSRNDIRMNVRARFPITIDTPPNRAAFGLLESLAKEAQVLSVMNSVSKTPHRGLLDMVAAGPPKKSSYLVSYAATGEQESNTIWSRRGSNLLAIKLTLSGEKDAFSRLVDVFATYDEERFKEKK